MIRERLAGRRLRVNDATVVVVFLAFGGKFVLGRCALQFIQRQFKLIQKPRGTLRARAIPVAVQLSICSFRWAITAWSSDC